MACPPPRMEIEGRYLRELEKAHRWGAHVDGIVLTDSSDAPVLVFERFTPPE